MNDQSIDCLAQLPAAFLQFTSGHIFSLASPADPDWPANWSFRSFQALLLIWACLTGLLGGAGALNVGGGGPWAALIGLEPGSDHLFLIQFFSKVFPVNWFQFLTNILIVILCAH